MRPFIIILSGSILAFLVAVAGFIVEGKKVFIPHDRNNETTD